MMDHRIRTIRTLLCLGLGCLFFGVGWLYVGAWFTALGLFMPVFASTCRCNSCNGGVSGTTPCEMQFVSSGISDANAECGDCDFYNGTWLLTRSPFPGTNAQTCVWTFDISPTHCIGSASTDVDQLRMSSEYSSPNHTLQIMFWSTVDTFAGFLRWRLIEAAAPTCSSFSSKEVTWNLDSSTGCQSDGTSGYVTAL